MTLSGAVPGPGDGAILRQISIVDKAKQAAAIIVLLFDELPTVASSNNVAIDITDAEMADKALASVSVASGDYAALANSSLATKATTTPLKAVVGETSLYAVAFTTGTPTYGSTSDLVFRFHFTWE